MGMWHSPDVQILGIVRDDMTIDWEDIEFESRSSIEYAKKFPTAKPVGTFVPEAMAPVAPAKKKQAKPVEVKESVKKEVKKRQERKQRVLESAPAPALVPAPVAVVKPQEWTVVESKKAKKNQKRRERRKAATSAKKESVSPVASVQPQPAKPMPMPLMMIETPKVPLAEVRLESQKANEVLKTDKIKQHMRMVYVGSVDKPEPSGKNANAFLNAGHVFVNKHVLEDKAGAILMPLGNTDNNGKPLDLTTLKWQPAGTDCMVAKIENWKIGNSLKIAPPGVRTPVVLFNLDKDGNLEQSYGIVTDERPADGTFGFSGTTYPTFCGGIYVHCATGSVVGMHFLGVTNQPNRGMTLSKN